MPSPLAAAGPRAAGWWFLESVFRPEPLSGITSSYLQEDKPLVQYGFWRGWKPAPMDSGSADDLAAASERRMQALQALLAQSTVTQKAPSDKETNEKGTLGEASSRQFTVRSPRR